MLNLKFTCRASEGWLGPGTSGKGVVYQSSKLMWKKGGEGAKKVLSSVLKRKCNDTIRHIWHGHYQCVGARKWSREELATVLGDGVGG